MHALPPEYFQVLGNYRMSPEHVRQSAGMGVIRALEFLVPTMLLMLGNQVMYQKFFSARSETDARVSVIGWILGTVLLETLIVAIAVFGRALYPTGEVALHPREIIPYTARHGLPAVMGAVLLGAVFAKVISTASNYLFSPATNLVEDVFVRYIAPGASNKRVLIVSRLAVVLLGCWALYQAVYAESILQEDAVGLHHLLRRADAGGAGGFLLQARNGMGRGGGHRQRHGGHAGLGFARREGDLSRRFWPTATPSSRRSLRPWRR